MPTKPLPSKPAVAVKSAKPAPSRIPSAHKESLSREKVVGAMSVKVDNPDLPTIPATPLLIVVQKTALDRMAAVKTTLDELLPPFDAACAIGFQDVNNVVPQEILTFAKVLKDINGPIENSKKGFDAQIKAHQAASRTFAPGHYMVAFKDSGRRTPPWKEIACRLAEELFLLKRKTGDITQFNRVAFEESELQKCQKSDAQQVIILESGQ